MSLHLKFQPEGCRIFLTGTEGNLDGCLWTSFVKLWIQILVTSPLVLIVSLIYLPRSENIQLTNNAPPPRQKKEETAFV